MAAPVIVSACLLGTACRYDGRSCPNAAVIAKLAGRSYIAVCPEHDGGLPTPRARSEIVSGDGYDVLRGDALVLAEDGTDVTAAFVRGARHALALAQQAGSTTAILKSNSPSCGLGRIYDGTFSGVMVPGDGVTVALLRNNGVTITTE